MNDHIEGIVLKESPYKEKDSLLSLLTKEGKIHFIAKGLKSPKSKNAGALQPFSKVLVDYDHREERDLQSLKRAKLLHFYRPLYQDLELSSLASILVDLVDRMATFPESKELYNHLELAFSLFEQKESISTVFLLSLSGLLQYFGFEPNVDACVHCSKQEVVSFSAKEGGFLCEEHALEFHSRRMNVEQLKQIRWIFKGNLSHFDVLKTKIQPSKQEIQTVLEMVKEHASLNLKSIAFYEHLFL